MSELIPVFVNDRAVRMAADCVLADAIAAADPELGRAVREGTARVTDGRGIALDPGAPVYSGAILRVVVSARRGEGTDAHP
ncbi:MAG TPA: hypothetical protein VLB00_17315 [Gemmatimonadales bacterium]|nr:hypothetical protein [Gemmatimonadales bacterium]